MNKSVTKFTVLLGALIVIIIAGSMAIFGLPKKLNLDKPVPIIWSKDICTQCGMSIVDRFHAAEIINSKTRKVYKFGDIGDAVVWAKHNHTSAWLKESKIWVTDSKTGKWLNARKAYWIKGQTTPMGYGLGAVSEYVQNSFEWRQAAIYLLKKRKSLLSGKIKMQKMKNK